MFLIFWQILSLTVLKMFLSFRNFKPCVLVSYVLIKKIRVSHFGPIAEMSRQESALRKKCRNTIKNLNILTACLNLEYNVLAQNAIRCGCIMYKHVAKIASNRLRFCGVLILSQLHATCSSAHLVNQLISDIILNNCVDKLDAKMFFTKK